MKRAERESWAVMREAIVFDSFLWLVRLEGAEGKGAKAFSDELEKGFENGWSLRIRPSDCVRRDAKLPQRREPARKAAEELKS